MQRIIGLLHSRRCLSRFLIRQCYLLVACLFSRMTLWSSSLLTSMFFSAMVAPPLIITTVARATWSIYSGTCYALSVLSPPSVPLTRLPPQKQHWSLKFLLAGTRVGGCPLLGFHFPFLLGYSLRNHPGLVPALNHLYVLLINVCKKALLIVVFNALRLTYCCVNLTMSSSWHTEKHPSWALQWNNVTGF